MDHPWRHRPPPPFQGKICPMCSTYHFPFCPPHPPSFNQNPIFQPHISHSLQRPFFDQFVDHQGPPGNLHRPFIGDRFGDPRPWYRSPSLEYEQFHGQSQVGDPATVNGGYGDGFPPSRYDHGGVGFKRTRDDEMDAGLFTSDNRMYSSRISSENERRLKLIRDHGIVASGSLQGGANTVSGTGMEFNREAKEYVQENSVFVRNFGNIDGSECRRLDELRGGRNDMTLKLPSNFGMNDFRDPGFGNFDRKGTSFYPELGFNPNNYREEAFGQQNMQNYSKEEIGQSRYSQGEDSLHPSLQANGHTDHPAGHSTNVEQGRQSQDVATVYGEGHLQPNSGSGGSYLFASQKGDLNKQLHNSLSQSVPYPISEAPNENYHRQRFQGAHPSDSLSAKEPQYSHLVSRQGWSASSAPHNEPGSFAMENPNSNRHMPQPYTMQHAMQPNHDFHSHGQLNDGRQSYEVNLPSHKDNQDPVGHQNMPPALQYGPRNLNKQGGYVPVHTGGSIVSEYRTLMQTSGVFNVQPPLPDYPPPSLTAGSAGHPLSEALAFSSPPKTSSSLFPIPVSSTATVPSSYAPIHEAHSLAQPYLHLKSHLHASTSSATEEFQTIKRTSSRKYMGEGQPFPLISSDKCKSIDASHIFKQPHRATRPDHIVIILRGLPGSGKSYLAKMLRDLEVENGGDAPRIHSMDDYFMIEVEKVEESDVSKSPGLVRGKKPIMKKVMEYCYEPEMEEAYRSSMLKAFKKTLDDSVFSFVIVDDRNLRVADFAQFWATAKRSGYEVYLLEATYKDPAGCAARNVHGFTQDDIQKMARQWEEAPSLYLKLDIKSLFHGEDLKDSGIQEVDMDIEDGDAAGNLSGLEERSSEKITVPPLRDISPDGSLRVERKWDAEGDHPREEVKELGRSKWSDDLDDDNTKRSEATKGNLNALSGLIKAYTKEGKSVHWGDQVGNTGFSIGAARKVNVSLVIGPGAGYNFKSNPLPEDHASTQNTGESKRQSIFQERIRAEHESFRVVFDKRRQRIGGLDLEVE